MFGGWKDIDFPQTEGQVGTFLNDTWAYDPVANTWTELKPSGGPPPPRQPDGMVYDPTTRRILVFGGAGDENWAQNDIWAYDPVKNSWTELNRTGPRPEKRWGAGIAYDSSRSQVILFGGSNADQSKYFSDTWLYDPAADTWTELKPSGTLPGARAAATVKYFEATDQVIMFAGLGPSGELKDLWAFER
jgi:N-acetylneuraminic acid mutarotase